jgi:hypothetical protein
LSKYFAGTVAQASSGGGAGSWQGGSGSIHPPGTTAPVVEPDALPRPWGIVPVLFARK